MRYKAHKKLTAEVGSCKDNAAYIRNIEEGLMGLEGSVFYVQLNLRNIYCQLTQGECSPGGTEPSKPAPALR